jgi:hypothetical protein
VPPPTSDRRSPTRPSFTSPNGGQLFGGRCGRQSNFHRFTRTIGAPAERTLKQRNCDPVGSGATRGASSSRKNEFVRDRSTFFQARGEIPEGPQASEIATRARAHTAAKRFSDVSRASSRHYEAC